MKQLKNNAFVGYTARGCADRAIQANFAFLPSIVLVTICSLPNVNPLFFPGIATSECQTGYMTRVLYRQHLQKLFHRHGYLCIHFFGRPVVCDLMLAPSVLI